MCRRRCRSAPSHFFFKDSFIRFFSPRSLPYIPYVVHTCVKRKEVKFLKNAKKSKRKSLSRNSFSWSSFFLPMPDRVETTKKEKKKKKIDYICYPSLHKISE